MAALWDVIKNREAGKLEIDDGPIGQVCFSRDSRMLALAGSQRLSLWNIRAAQWQSRVHASDGGAIDFSPDGRILATATGFEKRAGRRAPQPVHAGRTWQAPR